MFNEEEYIEEFVKAAVKQDSDRMVELSKGVKDQSVEDRIDLLTKLSKALEAEEEVDRSFIKHIDETIRLLKFVKEAKEAEEQREEDSTVEVGMDSVEPKEATEDVVADNSAEAGEDASDSVGNSPTEEEKEG